jgi:hypothetical protein
MKGKISEKRIYELLGVNFFRKYILGAYQALWNAIFVLTGSKFSFMKDIYKMRNFSTEGLKSFKTLSKKLALEHFIMLLFWTGLIVLTEGKCLNFFNTFIICTDIYAIMTQRYNHIRINEFLKKQEELEMRRAEKENLNIFTKKPKAIIEQYPLSIEEQRQRLQRLREQVLKMRSDDNYQEQFFVDEEKSKLSL